MEQQIETVKSICTFSLTEPPPFNHSTRYPLTARLPRVWPGTDTFRVIVFMCFKCKRVITAASLLPHTWDDTISR